MTTTNEITETSHLAEVQANIRRDCLIAARHNLKAIICDLEKVIGEPAMPAALETLRALAAVQRLEREVEAGPNA